MLNLVRRLFRDKKYRLSLLIGCGCFFGLRISDLKSLTWQQLLSGQKFSLTEQKTGKHREIKINEAFQLHIQDCYKALKVEDMTEHCFLNNRGQIITTQMINRHLKAIKAKYNVKVEHLSSHSFRKTFGRKVVQCAGEQSEMALIKLSEIFNHASPMITRRYLGLRAEELEEVYNVLEF
jgi:site-specific recombinase XerD